MKRTHTEKVQWTFWDREAVTSTDVDIGIKMRRDYKGDLRRS